MDKSDKSITSYVITSLMTICKFSGASEDSRDAIRTPLYSIRGDFKKNKKVNLDPLPKLF